MKGSRSKSKGKEITCFQCCHKGLKKLDCRFYKQELERNKRNQKDTSKKTDDVDNNKGKEREKATIASGVMIEEIHETEDTLCVADCYLYRYEVAESRKQCERAE